MARYELLPYWYTLFHHAERTGVPTMRPLWTADGFGADVRCLGDDGDRAFMAGEALLVHPISRYCVC
jgi:alpha 1,3-glucosidase